MVTGGRRRGSLAALLLAGLVLGGLLLVRPAAAAASSAGVAMEGEDHARILPPAGATIESYSNAGYHLRLTGDGAVEVTSELGALASRATFAPPQAAEESTPVAHLARSVTVGARTEYEAVSRILGWMARNLDYALDRSQSQAPEAVLERRSAYCTGIARLAVALIEAVGIEAREVAGYVIEPMAGSRDIEGFHRWIEVHISDRGWLFSDPLHSHHYVPASYVRLASEQVAPAAGLEGLLLERRDLRMAVDFFPAAPAGVTARRNDGRQRAAALRVRVEDQTTGTAILVGERRRFVHRLDGGTATFVGLDPGSYTLRLLLPGLPVVERAVELAGPVRTALFFPTLRPPAAASPSPEMRKGSP